MFLRCTKVLKILILKKAPIKLEQNFLSSASWTWYHILILFSHKSQEHALCRFVNVQAHHHFTLSSLALFIAHKAGNEKTSGLGTGFHCISTVKNTSIQGHWQTVIGEAGALSDLVTKSLLFSATSPICQHFQRVNTISGKHLQCTNVDKFTKQLTHKSPFFSTIEAKHTNQIVVFQVRSGAFLISGVRYTESQVGHYTKLWPMRIMTSLASMQQRHKTQFTQQGSFSTHLWPKTASKDGRPAANCDFRCSWYSHCRLPTS